MAIDLFKIGALTAGCGVLTRGVGFINDEVLTGWGDEVSDEMV